MSDVNWSDEVSIHMLSYDNIVADENSLWYIMTGQNILMEVDRKNGNLKMCGAIPGCTYAGINYRFLLKAEDNIYILPYEDARIYVYQIKDKRIIPCDIDINFPKKFKKWKLIGGKIVKDNIFLYGLHPILIRLNIKDKSAKIYEIKEKLPNNLSINACFGKYSYLWNNKIILFLVEHPYMIMFDLETETICSRHIGNESHNTIIDNPVVDGDLLWYMCRSKKNNFVINNFDLESGTMNSFVIGTVKNIGDRIFCYSSISNNKLWYLPCTIDSGFVYDIGTGIIESIINLPRINESDLRRDFPFEYHYRNGILSEDGYIIAIHAWSKCIISINTKTDKVDIKSICMTNRNELLNYFYQFDNSYNKEFFNGILEIFIDKLEEKKKEYLLKISIGIEIYQKLFKM